MTWHDYFTQPAKPASVPSVLPCFAGEAQEVQEDVGVPELLYCRAGENVVV